MKFADVSVIIPCYKSKDSIWRAIESVYNQTLRPHEVILVDDSSPDDTLSTLYEIRDFYPIGWVKIIALDKNSGPGSARNKGWSMAKGKYIAFLDSDDSWHPQKIEIQYGWMIQNPKATLTGHGCMQIKEEQIDSDFHEYLSSDVNFYPVSKIKLLLSNCFPTPSVMLKRNISQRFPMGKRYSEDYHLWLDIACAGLDCYRVDLPLAYLYKAAYGESGLSAKLWEMEKGELDSIWNLKNKGYIGYTTLFLFSSFSMAKYIKRSLIRVFK